MAAVMTVTITFDDGSSLTTTEAHEMTVDISKFLKDFLTAKKDAAIVTTLTIDFSAADTLTVSVA